MEKTSTRPKARCSLCSREIFDSINPEKIITCARCVQILLMASQQNKIEFRNSLLSKGLLEAARSIESFIIPEDKANDATFERTLVLRRSKYTLRGSKRLPHMSNRRI